MFKVILYSYLILKKMNERITEVNISTNIHNERIKTKYIPSYIVENEGKIFKKRKLRSTDISYKMPTTTTQRV